MLNNFSLLKLNRCIWVSLLEQEKTYEAINYYEGYKDSIILASKNKLYKEEAEIELNISRILFISKLQGIAKKYYQNRDYANALLCYTVIFKYNPLDSNITKEYIECLKNTNQHDLVIEIAKHLESLNPEDLEILKIISEAYYTEKNYDKAVDYLKKYIETKGEYNCDAATLNLLGCYYDSLYMETYNLDYIHKAVELFKKAYELNPNDSCFLKNITILAGKTNDYYTAKTAWEKLITYKNLPNNDKFDFACFSLKYKDFENWKKYYNARFEREQDPVYYPKLSKPEWDGVKDISNSTLLIHHEQGFGDTILTWGYIPKLKQLAKNIKIVVQNELYELLKDNKYSVDVIAHKDFDEKTQHYDYHIPTMSIPIVLNLNENNISVGENYIHIDPTATDEYKNKYFTNNNKIKIGLSISGSKTGNTTRDIPIKKIAKLDKLKNVEFYILTKDLSDEELNIFKKNKAFNIAKDFKNFKDTAMAIKNLDIVVTTDNCIMNLAGALGIKTYAIFNWSYESRWFDLTGENTIWLTSVKPFVNDKMNNWDFSIDNILKEINS